MNRASQCRLLSVSPPDEEILQLCLVFGNSFGAMPSMIIPGTALPKAVLGPLGSFRGSFKKITRPYHGANHVRGCHLAAKNLGPILARPSRRIGLVASELASL